MARFMTVVALLVVACLAMLGRSSHALTIGADGSIPATNATWGFNGIQKLTVQKGDKVFFSWVSGFHAVAEFPNKQNLTACAGTPVAVHAKSGTSGNYTLDTSSAKVGSKFFFYCPVTGHCDRGMKLTIKVVAAKKCSTLHKFGMCKLAMPHCKWAHGKCVRRGD